MPKLGFNTSVAAMMECLNTIRSGGRQASRSEVEPLIRMIAPFAPHMAEEIWEHYGHEGSIFDGKHWPSYDEAKTVESTVKVAVQVNGKLRGTIGVAPDTAEAEVIAAARADENVARHLEGVEERRVIHVPGRLVNFVVG
jgi:leucyl-tRNA synthetase